ncbi:hypothetical protein [Streptomyces sp. GQFP]|uniref:hypothetical protein n=1 Tax=Streptomyces sp. GQFP TaxID=2907545 RepID=UPI001F43391F|nr:hypothetical protein [Streptomyces sp. GQFP]UIX33529.1 hypothetical protein LUX31_27950 [Streptomyces sp. GQFP]
MTTDGIAAPPGPGFVAGICLGTGVHRGYLFPVAQLLAYHAPPHLDHESVDSIREGMQAFAEGLRLGPHDGPPPRIGHRIRIRQGSPWLDYGDGAHRLQLPAARSWLDVVEAGGPVRILVVFEPLADGAGKTEIDAHVRECFERGAMRWGTTYHV